MLPSMLSLAWLLVPFLFVFPLSYVKRFTVEPPLVVGVVMLTSTLIGGLATANIVDWFPTSFITEPRVPVLILGTLAVLPVAAGLTERAVRRHGQAVYSARFRHWFLEHLKNNLLGAFAGVAILLYLHSIQGEVLSYVTHVSWGDLTEGILGIAAAATFLFVAIQQRHERARMNRIGGRPNPTLWSTTLRNVNQVLNAIWLTYIFAICVRGGVYIFGVLHHMRASGTPMQFSGWELWPLSAIMLFFFLGCATDPDKPPIYVTFLTGTPVAILAEHAWLGLYQKAPLINVVMWVYPGVLLLMYAGIVGLNYTRQKTGPISLMALVPTVLGIIGFLALAFVA